MREAVLGSFESAAVTATDIDAGHVGNFVGELFAGQGHLGGMLAAIDPGCTALRPGVTRRLVPRGASLCLRPRLRSSAGRYDCVLVTGVELERNVPSAIAAQQSGRSHLGRP